MISNSVRNSKLTEPIGLSNFSPEMTKVFAIKEKTVPSKQKPKVFHCFSLAAVNLRHFHSVMGLIPNTSAKKFA